MFRKVIGAALIALVIAPGPLWASPEPAEGARPQAPAAKSGSGKRVAWILVGAGAGFAAGMLFGLNKFDDATNSDRKVWTSAILGAAGGGVAAALLSRNVGRGPSPGVASVARPPVVPNVSWASALRGNANVRDVSKPSVVR